MVGRWNFPLTWSLFWGHVNFRRDISSLICFSIYIVVLHQVNLEDSQTSGWIPRVQRSHQLSRPDNGMSNPTHVTSPKWNCEAVVENPESTNIFKDSKVMIICLLLSSIVPKSRRTGSSHMGIKSPTLTPCPTGPLIYEVFRFSVWFQSGNQLQGFPNTWLICNLQPLPEL